MARAAVALLLLALLASCGTYSLLRPADTLRAGQVELGAGVAVAAGHGYSEAVGHARAHVGLTDWLELGAQYEEYTTFAEVRFGLLSSERHGIALALGAGAGVYTAWQWNVAWDRPLTLTSNTAGLGEVSLTLGRRWRWLEVYAGDRFFAISADGSTWGTLNAVKAGVRFTLWRHLVLGLEGGATLHDRATWMGEWTLSVGLTFGGRPRAPAATAPPPPPPPPASAPASLPAPRAPAVPPGDLAL
jgi:hypothetical protein